MKCTIVWASPKPERTIAIAMRRCYSTKTIEEIESELDQKGESYWKHLMEIAIRDKSLDVIEHFCMTVLLDGLDHEEACKISARFPFAKLLEVTAGTWLVSINARTLMEAWNSEDGHPFATAIVSALRDGDIGTGFATLAFPGGAS